MWFLDGRTRMQEEKKQDLQKCAKDIDILDRELGPQMRVWGAWTPFSNILYMPNTCDADG